MSFSATVGRLVGQLVSKALSVPVLVKVLGAVTVVAWLFGGVVNLYVRHSLSANLSRLTEQATRANATAFAARAEHLLITGNRTGLRDLVRRESKAQASIRYVVVYDARRRVVAHSFRHGPPPSLVASLPRAPIRRTQVRTLRTRDEVIFEALVPIVEGRAGLVQLGTGSRPISRRVDRMVTRLWLVLGACLIAGLLLIVPLVHAMTAPLRRLVHATNMLRQGKLSFRAPDAPMDEIGELTAAFNRMADEQERQREELDAKEAERLKLLEAIVQSQEDERRRIAHDLHDELGGSLSALLIELRVRNEQCGTTDDQQAAWGSIEHNVNQMISKVRHLAWTLRPAALDDIGLCAALEQHTAHIRQQTGASVEFCGRSSSCKGCRCPSDVKVALYRIAQEALTNCLRHAQAERISVIVVPGRQGVSVLVEDDGCGFDTDAEPHEVVHLGLRGMEERASLVGGTITIESTKGSGTIVRATVPISDWVIPAAGALVTEPLADCGPGELLSNGRPLPGSVNSSTSSEQADEKSQGATGR